MLEIRRLSLEEFAQRVVPFLAAREVEHNLILGIVARHLASHPPQSDAVWLALEDDGAVVGAAVRTPPQYVVVTELPPGGARALADWFIALGTVPDGASGPGDDGRDVLVALRSQLGGRVELHSAETIYELTRVADIPEPPGVARTAGETDRALLTAYLDAFIREVKLPRGPDAREMAARHIAGGTALLWDDGGPRSLACRARKTPTGCAIGPVYTPPEARGRGYGTAVTAALARRELDAGSRFVCLFAEQKNPTANRIY
ncbi:MAG TPA: GNAT family N-acetyltransferase, partial [Polyangiaceae bacterium]|nr:GNAT family N-acetyltransferase [Polyangiaceae bacterium]